jgi:hypothetical protein
MSALQNKGQKNVAYTIGKQFAFLKIGIAFYV